MTAAEALSVRRDARLKVFKMEKIQERPQHKVTKAVTPEFRKVLVKADKYSALALVRLQTQEGDLIDSKFIYLYRIPTRSREIRILTTVIKGLQRTIDKECTVQLDWMGYLKVYTIYVAHV